MDKPIVIYTGNSPELTRRLLLREVVAIASMVVAITAIPQETVFLLRRNRIAENFPPCISLLDLDEPPKQNHVKQLRKLAKNRKNRQNTEGLQKLLKVRVWKTWR